MIQGFVHSIESMGLVDGPGIRTVVFMQGCFLRCRYCHNPDTWALNSTSAKLYTAEELVKKLVRFKPYYGDKGGVTFSGGEPLLQSEFLLECLKLCKERGIHTCIDTAGYTDKDYSQILNYTDLILFDTKHFTKDGYKTVTGFSIDKSEKFLKDADSRNIPIWIRHVVVPNLTDGEEHIKNLALYLKQFKNIRKADLLSYHTLGVYKYEKLGIEYPLKDTPPMDKNITENLQQLLNKTLNTQEEKL